MYLLYLGNIHNLVSQFRFLHGLNSSYISRKPFWAAPGGYPQGRRNGLLCIQYDISSAPPFSEPRYWSGLHSSLCGHSRRWSSPGRLLPGITIRIELSSNVLFGSLSSVTVKSSGRKCPRNCKRSCRFSVEIKLLNQREIPSKAPCSTCIFYIALTFQP